MQTFEEQTHPLTEHEKRMLPDVADLVETTIQTGRPISSKEIIKRLKDEHNWQTSGPRLRKVIHALRTSGEVPGLIATGGGYLVATSEAQLLRYEETLKSREDAIRAARLSIAHQRRALYEKAQTNPEPTIFDALEEE